MTAARISYSSFIRQEGGAARLATFFALFSTAAFIVGCLAIAPQNRDTLLRDVPRSAVVYGHGRGDAGIGRLQALLPATLPSHELSEVSVFAVPDRASPDGLSWAWLIRPRRDSRMRWSAGNLDAELLPGGRVMVMGDKIAKHRLRLALGTDAVMAGDTEVKRALARQQAVSTSQMYAEPNGLSGLFGVITDQEPESPVLVWLQCPGRLVVSLATANVGDGFINSCLGPLPTEDPHVTDWADFSVCGQGAVPSGLAASVVFGDGGGELPMNWPASGVFDSVDYLAAGLHDGVYQDYLVHFSSPHTDDITDAIIGYYAVRHPVFSSSEMPDGTVVKELVLDREWLGFSLRADGSMALSSINDSGEFDLPDITLWHDDRGGVWLTSFNDRAIVASMDEEQPVGAFGQICFPLNETRTPFLSDWLDSEKICVDNFVDNLYVIHSSMIK